MFGHYKITGELGRGGMGEVYRAEDTKKRRTVALKILAEQFWQDERFRTRFQRESHAAAILQEPHVIPIHDWGEINGHPYIDMRLVDGQTLQQLLRTGPLDPARATFLISGVAAALDAAHAAGLVHRDVKPQNIIVTLSDFPYLVDFGIAEAKGDSGLTTTGMQIGTFDYMAPERFRDREVTPAADVYSLACVLYECLTGVAPFPKSSLEQMMSAHLMSPPPRPSVTNPAVPTAFDEVISRGMAKEPDDRYGSCGALGRAAQRAVGSGNVIGMASADTMSASLYRDGGGGAAHRRTEVAPPPPPLPRAAPSASAPGGPSRPWLLPAAIAVVGALLLGGIGIVIGLLANRDSGTQTTAARDTPDPTARQTITRPARPTTTPRSPRPAEVPLGVGSPPPPAVAGLDTSENPQSCEDDYFLTDRSGAGTRSRRGSPETSCLFTQSVLRAYWSTYDDASRDLREVAAPGAVDCRTVLGSGSGCAGPNFVVQCVVHPGDAFITCTGGRDAVVYLY
ncbi:MULTISPECIES: serine/threonine-protein kinase [unclassified Mycobacterium]|uniref:serine/threonine-protein kinase n=1 Tax=unclassified Mycobacterium TaxID=2642494 RepID=UPI00074019A5|nr:MULTISPECIES: serine/threonine-protein kinase [unclassified Mycobacterium]KUH81392.1 serine/threonine protein kinase [Mycobacterium sp. GA-0227b]KUH83522.1 serine/threonine protein kinase [Mycobacterium sp. GA-1999]